MCSCFKTAENSQIESRHKNELDEASRSMNFSFQQRELYVRIVHAGGFVDLYRYAVPASQLMEKYPGMYVTRPEVFKRPHESLVQPEEMLQPGQKFYLVPRKTIRKLKRKHPEMSKTERSIGNGEELSWRKIDYKEEDDFSEESSCSVSPERWSRFVVRRYKREVKKPFVPPIRGAKMWQGLGWQPSIPSVKEISP